MERAMPVITPETNRTAPTVVVIVDGREISLTREQEALIRAWASGPV